jgi:quinol-cytochrome oxidoreductase complex cytochrome b subunit
VLWGLPMSDRKSRLLDWLSDRLNLTEIFSLLTSYGLFYAELDTSKPLREALAEATRRPMRSYARWPRGLGLIVVVLIAIEIVTGGLLALYYLPTPGSAHASLGTMLRDVQFGWFVHQIHFWGAQLLVAVLIVRLLRFFLQRVYSPPRELTWVFGALLLLVCLHLDTTGRVLPMTASAFWSTVRSLELVAAVPLYGPLAIFLLGGEQTFVSDLTLIRFYVLHVAVLPMMAVALIYFHFSGVRRVGLSMLGKEKSRVGGMQMRMHVANLAIVLALLFGLLVSLAVLVPVPFEAAADPYATPPGARPPWYLLASFGFLEWTSGLLPQWLAGGLLLLGFLAFIVVPFVDHSRPGGKRGALRLVLAILAIVAWILLTGYGARVA